MLFYLKYIVLYELLNNHTPNFKYLILLSIIGHEYTAAYRAPKKVEAFEGIGVIEADCGEDFTIALTGKHCQ